MPSSRLYTLLFISALTITAVGCSDDSTDPQSDASPDATTIDGSVDSSDVSPDSDARDQTSDVQLTDATTDAQEEDMTSDEEQDSSQPEDCQAGGTVGTAVDGKLVCNPSDLEYLYTSDACGNPIGRSTTRCFSPKECEEHAVTGQAFCSCPLTGELTCKASNANFPQSLYDDTYVVKERACSNGPLDPADIIETCDFGSVCFKDTYMAPNYTPRNNGAAFCARSTTDTSSPYYDFACTTAFPEHMRYPTDLEIDCRCRVGAVAGSQANGGGGTRPADPNNFDLSVDPDAHPKGRIMDCESPTKADLFQWPIPAGNGPVFDDYNDGIAFWYGAEFNQATREVFAVVLWTDSTYERTASVVAWNVDTKDRRVVSGVFPGSVNGYETFGSGYDSPKSLVTSEPGTQPMTQVEVVRLGNDGNLYVSSTHEIIRVDLQTGERTLIWKRQVEALTGDISSLYGQCFRPDRRGVEDGLQMEQFSFEVGPNMEFYKAFRDGRGGNGILQISSDGLTCTVMARWGDAGDPDPSRPGGGVPAAPDIGNGASLQRFPIYGMLHHNSKLYAVTNSKLVEFEPTTGNHRRVDDPNVSGAIGYTSMFWDAGRQVIWASGSLGATYGGSVIDPVTGQNELIVSDTGLRNYPGQEILLSVYPGGGSAANPGGGATTRLNITTRGGVVLDPNDSDITYGVTNVGSLLKLELSTFNNYVHSRGQY